MPRPVTGSIYLAARYSRRLEIADYKAQLEADGWTVWSRSRAARMCDAG